MRGFHITVRDFKTRKIITDEYGPAGGGFPDSRKQNGKVLWFRPSDYMSAKYKEGEENTPGYEVKQYKRADPDFDIDYYPNKWEWYFAKTKKSNFLPKCLRDIVPAWMKI